MESINETKKLAKLMGVLIALPCGIALGVKVEIVANKIFGDASGQSLFPFPLLFFSVAIIIGILVYKIFTSLSEKYISTENYKSIRTPLIIIGAIYRTEH